MAERRKAIELIQATQEAEREGSRMRLAPRPRSWRRSTAPMPSRIDAEGEAEAEKIRALASSLRYEIEAEGMRLMNEAQNMLTPEFAAPRICGCACSTSSRESSAKASGPWRRSTASRSCMWTGSAAAVCTALAREGGGNFADSMVNSALRYRAQAPLVDSLLKEMGLTGADLTKLGNMMREPIGADGDDELK